MEDDTAVGYQMNREDYPYYYVKTLNVICSCKTVEHLSVADKYLKLAKKNLNNDDMRILATFAFAKQYEIMEDIAGLAGSQS